MKSLILLVSLLAGIMVHSQTPSLTVIGNPNGVPGELKQSELRSIFMGETTKWVNGSKVVLALMKTNTAAGKLTCEKIYHMSSDEVTKFWLSQVISGKAEAPIFFNTIGELQAFIAGNPGAIGIIDLSAPIAGVHAVQVDGKRSF